MQNRSQNPSDEVSELESAPEFVRALAKGLAVIEAFDSSAPAMRLSDVAKKTQGGRPQSRNSQ